jgi:hypothetical protein
VCVISFQRGACFRVCLCLYACPHVRRFMPSACVVVERLTEAGQRLVVLGPADLDAVGPQRDAVEQQAVGRVLRVKNKEEHTPRTRTYVHERT